MKKNDCNIVDLCDAVKKLKEENSVLTEKNVELAKRLDAKRYKVVDFVTDSFYKIIRRSSRKQQLIDDNLHADKKVQEAFCERANPVDGRVDIVNMNFYDWDGKVVYKGGAERYVYDLACLLKDMGYKPRILQCSNVPFQKKYEGINVVGLGVGDKSNMRTCSLIYNSYCKDAEFVIASPLELASEITSVPVIGINHGINFDGDWNQYDAEYPHLYNDHMDALRNVFSCICVDTNFINFTRTQDYALSLKERYIPNYYDQKQFARTSVREKSNKVTFVYPRRLYNARGVDITIEAFEKILPKYKDRIILNFVGQVDNDDARARLEKIMSDYPENVFHYEYSMNEMPKAYKEADVVLVPTRYSEGTSLSCIEGMASGAAIITTNVGGLTNLVIDGFNGRLISPTTDDLVEAATQMILRPEMRVRFARNGLSIAKEAFSKKNWDSGWKKEIERLKKSLLELES